MKPAEYRYSCIIAKDIPYNVIEGALKGSQPGIGTLHVGRVVWLDHQMDTGSAGTDTQAFVDGIGLITVDSGSLSASR